MDFKNWLINNGKSKNTIDSYSLHIAGFQKWFKNSFGREQNILYRENILDYISYLLNIKHLNGKSVNAKLSALLKFNEYLITKNVQSDYVISKNDYIKIQAEYLNPVTITKIEVDSFRQIILENRSKRDYALITLLIYSGLRVSEALNIRINDMDLVSKEILVRYGKGKKQRIIVINDKIVNAIKEYFKERENSPHSSSEYLFISRESDCLNRTSVNRIFNLYGNKITPHKLRHFFCSYALESGWSTHEVALQAGHSNIHTTMTYTHPSITAIKNKANML